MIKYLATDNMSHTSDRNISFFVSYTLVFFYQKECIPIVENLEEEVVFQMSRLTLVK